MSGWLVEGNTVIDAQMAMLVGGGRDLVIKDNRFIDCDKALHIDSQGMTVGEKGYCLGPCLTCLKIVMDANLSAWAKYGLTDQMSPDPSALCSPVNMSVTGNCFYNNTENWELYCGAPSCLNELKWLSHESGNENGTCS